MSKKLKQITNNPETYIESIGSHDKGAIRLLAKAQITGSVLRTVYGATEAFPARSLGYVASALNVANILPVDQIQFVHAINTSATVNGTSLERCRAAAVDFSKTARRLVERHFPDQAELITFVTDPETLPEMDASAIDEAIGEQSLNGYETLREVLASAATTRDTHYAPYVAAHLVMHDSDVDLVRLTEDEPETIETDTIVSLGAQSERPFYLARAYCKAAGIYPPDAVTDTSQLFTKHVLPPYLPCKEGEPLVGEDRDFTTHPVHSVRRDLAYVAPYLEGAMQ